MKAKTIKSVLRRKFDSWAASIDDTTVRDLVKRDALITGGAIASMLLNEQVNDYDVYFKTRECTLAVAKHYVAKFKLNPPPRFKATGKSVDIHVDDRDSSRVKIVVKSQGIAGETETTDYQYFEQVTDPSEPHEFVEQIAADLEHSKGGKDAAAAKKPEYRPVFLSSNAISLSDAIQIVIRFYGPVEDIHANYDFAHCKCSWEAETGELRLPQLALECLLNRDLVYTTSKYPLCSIIRTRKFLARGWKINAGQYVKMAWDLNKLDLTNIAVLEDQMIGVDSAYFMQVIELLKQKGEKVDDAYLIEVIDKIF